MTERYDPRAVQEEKWLNRRNVVAGLIGAAAVGIPGVTGIAAYYLGYRNGENSARRELSPPPLGYDVSYIQTDIETLPDDFSFAIVGINNGRPTEPNPMLADQLKNWATKADGSSEQPPLQLYVNTANPGDFIEEITTWPEDNIDPAGNLTDNPYGKCDGTNSHACSWQYGWNRAVETIITMFVPAAKEAGVSTEPADYRIWLDVEPYDDSVSPPRGNSWQSGSEEAYERNVATLEAMTSYLQERGAAVGLYSTHRLWDEVVADAVGPESNLNGLDSWIAGAASAEDAKRICNGPGLTEGSRVALAQDITGNININYSCLD